MSSAYLQGVSTHKNPVWFNPCSLAVNAPNYLIIITETGIVASKNKLLPNFLSSSISPSYAPEDNALPNIAPTLIEHPDN